MALSGIWGADIEHYWGPYSTPLWADLQGPYWLEAPFPMVSGLHVVGMAALLYTNHKLFSHRDVEPSQGEPTISCHRGCSGADERLLWPIRP